MAFATDATLVADAHVNSARPTVNYGGLSNISVSGSTTGLIQFDLGSLPAGTTAGQISKATLLLYVNRMNTGGSLSVLPLTGAWTEFGVTFNTLPTAGSSLGTLTVGTSGQFVSVDVTAAVQGWVTSPDSNHGLEVTSTGASVLLDAKENDETGHAARLDIVLASQGPIGPAGAQGPIGPAGPTGAAGPIGPVGPVGPAGANGAAGPAGPVGATGGTGATGPIGPAGPTGATGAAGPVGATGPAGANGATGPTGVAGPSGPVGPIGPAGANGATGPAGVAGPIGPAGVAGPVGPAGANGAAGPAGATGPIGPAGANGATGPAGPVGPTGVAGPAGPAGANGATGPAGPAGVAGPPGANGATGPAGVAGPIGPAGPAGTPGSNGAAGPVGPAGATGPRGLTGGQIWSSNTVLPTEISSGDSTGGLVSLPSGTSTASRSVLSSALPVPQACTASGFRVTVADTNQGGATMIVSLAYGSGDMIATSNTGFVSGLGCTVTSPESGVASCTSTATQAFTSDQFFLITSRNLSNIRAFEGARVLVSFLCN